jgi:hypothetical protein
MGSAHDVETSKGDDGVLTDRTSTDDIPTPSVTGPEPLPAISTRSWRIGKSGIPGLSSSRIGSSRIPNITYCGGFPCGTSDADNARSLRQTMPIIADFRPTAVGDSPPFEVGNGVRLKQLDVNGDARSDLFFFNHPTNRLSVWFMKGYTRLSTSSSNINGDYRVVDTGDLDGNGRSDILLGTILNRSPTRPMSAISKIGASAILVDRDDGAGVLDAGQVLDRAGDADRDVQLRRDDLAGLADLHVVGHVAGIHRGARGADGGAELVGQLVDDLEVLGRADAAAAGDHARGALQVGAVALALLAVRRSGCASAVRRRRSRFDRRAAAVAGGRPGGGADGRDHRSGRPAPRR